MLTFKKNDYTQINGNLLGFTYIQCKKNGAFQPSMYTKEILDKIHRWTLGVP